MLWGTTLFYKRALSGPATGWHRDGQVWPIKPLATTSVWIAATESTARNGCLRMIPGSHAAQRIGEHVFEDRKDMIVRRSLARDEFDESTAVDIELEPGQMVMFDVYTVHGATHNRGDVPRAGTRCASCRRPATSTTTAPSVVTSRVTLTTQGHCSLRAAATSAAATTSARGHPLENGEAAAHS